MSYTKQRPFLALAPQPSLSWEGERHVPGGVRVVLCGWTELPTLAIPVSFLTQGSSVIIR